MSWEWKIESYQLSSSLQSRPTLDTAPGVPGPRFDEELSLPIEEITLRADGVPDDDPVLATLRTNVKQRAFVMTLTDKLGRDWTGKRTSFSEKNHDGTDRFEITVTLRMEQT